MFFRVLFARLTGTQTPLNRTGVAEVINEAGLGRMAVRPAGNVGPPFRDHPRWAMIAANLITDRGGDLDLHAIMH